MRATVRIAFGSRFNSPSPREGRSLSDGEGEVRIGCNSVEECKSTLASPSPGLRAQLSGRNKFGWRESEVRGMAWLWPILLALFATPSLSLIHI